VPRLLRSGESSSTARSSGEVGQGGGSGLASPNDIAEPRRLLDVVGQFISDRCESTSFAQTGNTELFKAFDSWRRDQAEPERSQKWFTGQMKDKGYVQKTPTGGPRTWFGIGLLPD